MSGTETPQTADASEVQYYNMERSPPTELPHAEPRVFSNPSLGSEALGLLSVARTVDPCGYKGEFIMKQPQSNSPNRQAATFHRSQQASTTRLIRTRACQLIRTRPKGYLILAPGRARTP